MNRDDLDRMAAWLREQADLVEKTEPYATTQIEGLRAAADYADMAEDDDDA